MQSRLSLTTSQAAKAISVNKMTLLRWLWAGVIPEPRVVMLGGVKYRLFTQGDVMKALEYKSRPHKSHAKRGARKHV